MCSGCPSCSSDGICSENVNGERYIGCDECGNVFNDSEPSRGKVNFSNSTCTHGSLVHVVYRDHVLFRNCESSQIHPAVRQAVGWIAGQNEEGLLLLSERPLRMLPNESQKYESGQLILKTDILRICKLTRSRQHRNPIFRNARRRISEGQDSFSRVSTHRTAKSPVPLKAKKEKNMQTFANLRKQQPLATLAFPKQKTAQIITCQPDVENFVREALQKRKPSLIQFAILSPTVMELARYLKRHCSGSHATAYLYVRGVYEYCKWCGIDPDKMVADCLTEEDLPNGKALKLESRRLSDYLGALQDEKLSPGHISNCVKAVKALFRASELSLELPYKLHRHVVSRDRAPTPEEIERMTELANLRDKIIVLMLALGGFRVGTLTKLQYRHVKFDLERGVTPIHVQVEAEITKGKYGDYDTFIGKEGSDLLKAYFEARRNGGLPSKMPPESIIDESPLIRDEHAKTVKPITPSQVYNIVHRLLAQAGLLGSKTGRRYEVRPHSFRKFFRTQIAALGVQTDYIEYMMGHTISTYHDVKMKGIEFLRGIYKASGLCIKSKTKPSRMEMLKEMIRSLGMNPEQILTKEAMSMPNRTVVTADKSYEGQMETLLKALRQKLKEELFEKPIAESKTV